MAGRKVVNGDDEDRPLIPLDEVKTSIIRKEVEIFLLMIATIGFGAANSVAGKIMTEPMENYSFFLSLFNGIAYVFFYGAILGVRTALGYVPKENDLKFPFRKAPPSTKGPAYCFGKIWTVWDNMWAVKYFIAIGLMDSLGNILGNIARPWVSGIMASLSTQTMLLFAMPAAIIMLGTKYTIWQVLGAVVVLIGALVAVVGNLFTSDPSKNGPVGYILLMILSNIPSAISFTLKELVFSKQKKLELFVVNTFGSLFQLLWWPILIPFDTTKILKQNKGVPLPIYIRHGLSCFFGTTPPDSEADCGPMPYPYLVYICFNLLFNISLLALLKRASALQGFMAVKAILPVSVFLFLINWPLIGKSTLSIDNVVSLLLILTGLGLYRWATFEKEKETLSLQE